MVKSPLMRLIELQRGQTIEALVRQGVEQGKRQEEIAQDLGISYHTLRSWLYRMGATPTVRFSSEEATATR